MSSSPTCPPASDNPVSKLLIAYEREFFRGATLDEVLDYAKPLVGAEHIALSGLYDLRSSLHLVDEYYCQYPILDWEVLVTDAGTYHPLWNEHLGNKKFSRTVKLPTHIAQDKKTFRRTGAGENATQPATMVLPITHLWRQAYLPKTGDQVRYRSTIYQILAVHVQPSHYWQQTGFPLYVTCDMGIAPLDSRYAGADCCGLSREFEEETDEPGVASKTEPTAAITQFSREPL